jgi:membrane protease subunit HflK
VRVEVTAAMVRSLGEMGVDRVLADGRRELIAKASHRAQAGLDAAHSGLELVSLELTQLTPPGALGQDFDAVQTAYITAETRRKDAESYAQQTVPGAHAEADAVVQSARADAAAALASARGDAAAFEALAREYRTRPAVVREQLYRDTVETAIGRAREVRWVPPPVGGRYEGLRVVVPAQKAGAARPPRSRPGEPEPGEAP